MKIFEKIAKVQKQLKAPKDQRNNFGNYNYRSCEGILEALKPHLADAGLALFLADEIKEVSGRFYVEATALAVDVEDGEQFSVKASAREEESKKGMDGSQVTGASSSYARKYALNGMFAIDDNRDSDVTNTHGKGDGEGGGNAGKNKTPEKPNESYLIRVGAEEYFNCADCKNPSHAFSKKDGTIMTAKEMLDMSVRDFGRPLCRDCYKNELKK